MGVGLQRRVKISLVAAQQYGSLIGILLPNDRDTQMPQYALAPRVLPPRRIGNTFSFLDTSKSTTNTLLVKRFSSETTHKRNDTPRHATQHSSRPVLYVPQDKSKIGNSPSFLLFCCSIDKSFFPNPTLLTFHLQAYLLDQRLFFYPVSVRKRVFPTC
jgi:hypothetical protein